jgi:hypothetical protein
MSSAGAPREARIRWEQLGWHPPAGEPGPGLEASNVGFLVVAPWCPDCQDLGSVWKKLQAQSRTCWLVGEFASAGELQEYRGRLGISWPFLLGTQSKTELTRLDARFRQIRGAFGDDRRWGVPSWIEGRIEHGWLIATAFKSNF